MSSPKPSSNSSTPGRFARFRHSLARTSLSGSKTSKTKPVMSSSLPVNKPVAPAAAPITQPTATGDAVIASMPDNIDFNLEEFHRRKTAMIDADFASAGGKPLLSTQSDIEKAAQKSFARLVEECEVDPAKPFVRTKDSYTNSKLFKTMTTMPKGAILHTHGLSTVDFAKLTLRLCQDERAWVWEGVDTESVVHHGFEFAWSGPPALPAGAEKDQWVNCSSMYKKNGDEYRQQLESYITMDITRPSAEGWDMLKDFWSRVAGITRNATIWYGSTPEAGLFWTVLEDLLATGVTYVEIKEVVSTVYYDIDKPEEDSALPLEEVTRRFVATVELFKRAHPRFQGAKIVWTSIKIHSKDIIQEDLAATLKLKQMFPNHVAGFDMAGHEDVMHPISHHAEDLLHIKQRAHEMGVSLPLMLHAGETHDPTNTQLYDAVLVGCARIGHGYAIPRHPTVLNMVKEKNIVVECCPLSNMCLGFVDNLANHAGWSMLNSGLILTISHDDPGMYGYFDVTYDWVAVVKAWGLTLSQVAKMVRDSIVHSTLKDSSPGALESALAQLDEDWAAFVALLAAMK